MISWAVVVSVVHSNLDLLTFTLKPKILNFIIYLIFYLLPSTFYFFIVEFPVAILDGLPYWKFACATPC